MGKLQPNFQRKLQIKMRNPAVINFRISKKIKTIR